MQRLAADAERIAPLQSMTDFMRLKVSTLISIFAVCLLCLPLAALAQARTPETKPSTVGGGSPDAGYRIRQGDKLSVKFLYHPELTDTALVVRPDGFISLQLIEDVRAEGMTVSQLKKHLEKAYEEILLTPVITVTLVEYVPPRVFIGGQVNKPGRYDLRDAQTLVQVIFLAGGFTRDANRRMVLHARPNGSGSGSSSSERRDWRFQSANVLKILNEKGEEQDIVLQDGDYIFIPDSKISQINKAIEGFRGLVPFF
ncbi:MAG: polysaccharide export protein [Acidobacteriota bacterium]|nr:polysaccharide export protein [Acidobacteriota bacterium]